MNNRYFKNGMLFLLATASCLWAKTPAALPYTIVDTSQIRCYDNTTEIAYPKSNTAFYGQDAQYGGNQPTYKDNGNGTITDLNTGLMWTKDPGKKKTYALLAAGASRCKTGGYNDWRLPSIKELYSLILFNGADPDPMAKYTSKQQPFIDLEYFDFDYGNTEQGDRIIDSQYATSTIYRSTTMNGNKTMFGVNFADGRIKGYPIGSSGRREKTYYAMYVRGNNEYGANDFQDNADQTVTDKATGLMWMKIDSGHLKAGTNKDGKLNWQEAIQWAENLEYGGYSNWRLPNAKELQSLVDYSRCPDATKSAAIDPVFKVSTISNEGNKVDYPFYWSSTTHLSATNANAAVYVSFGRALGWMKDRRSSKMQLQDVHGAGAQRSDPKSGDASRYPNGRGPQGDVIRIDNFVRCVRGGIAEPVLTGPKIEAKSNSKRPNSRQSNNLNGSGKHDFVGRLDTDGDGKVSEKEFDGPSHHFKDLDRNNDGYLSDQEAPKGPPPK